MRTLLAALALILSASSFAQSTSTCGDIKALIQDTFSFIGRNNTVFQLRRGGQVYAILALSVVKPQGGKANRWRLLEREGESLTYCVTAEGTAVTFLTSAHAGNPPAKYGLPGSGNPRCFVPRPDALPGSLEVRLWANKELGDSTVIHLESNAGESDFIFLTSNDSTGYWILLQTERRNINNTCYRSRGDASDVRADYWPFAERPPVKR